MEAHDDLLLASTTLEQPEREVSIASFLKGFLADKQERRQRQSLPVARTLASEEAPLAAPLSSPAAAPRLSQSMVRFCW